MRRQAMRMGLRCSRCDRGCLRRRVFCLTSSCVYDGSVSALTACPSSLRVSLSLLRGSMAGGRVGGSGAEMREAAACVRALCSSRDATHERGDRMRGRGQAHTTRTQVQHRYRCTHHATPPHRLANRIRGTAALARVSHAFEPFRDGQSSCGHAMPVIWRDLFADFVVTVLVASFDR